MADATSLEHIINNNFMSHFDRWNILCNSQHGFRKHQSCETQLMETIADIARHLSDGNQIDVVLFDFEKAFNKVSHSRPLYKLDCYGVRGKVSSWIKAFLSGIGTASRRGRCQVQSRRCIVWCSTGHSSRPPAFSDKYQRHAGKHRWPVRFISSRSGRSEGEECQSRYRR